MSRPNPVRAFNDDAARPPSRWRKVAAVVLTILLPLALWNERGAAVGLGAFVVYGGIFLHAAFSHRRTAAWSQRHPTLDAALIVPLVFFAVAYATELPTATCIVIAIAAGVVLVPVALWRRRQRRGA